MSRKHLVGIGGTGARVIEAAIFLCAAGYGPDNLTVFLIDADKGNGNLTRTKSLIDAYNGCRKNYQRAPGSRLFATEIVDPDPVVWSIFDEQNVSLASYINYSNMKQVNPDLASFASVLFTGGDNNETGELNTPLNEGFRGHPSIGAVVMSDPPKDENPWKALWGDISNSASPNDVLVFLIGSIFGGTGAAGVPTIGSRDMIKFCSEARMGENISKVLLGGALVLPYFTFQKETEGLEGQMFVTTDDFYIATKAALQYYNEKVQRDLGFDQIYLLGDSLGQNVGRFSPGKKEQENRPHYIELFSALAAYDFFQQSPVKDNADKKYFISCRDDEAIGWDAMPFSRNADDIEARRAEFKSLLVSMTAFSYSIATYGKDIMARRHDTITDTWYKKNFKFNEKDDKSQANNPRTGSNEETIKKFIRFAELYLTWICSMDDEKVHLIDKNKLVSGEILTGQTVKLQDYNSPVPNIGNFLKGAKENPDAKFSTMQAVMNEVADDKIKTMSGADKFVNVFYLGAKNFCGRYYK